MSDVESDVSTSLYTELQGGRMRKMKGLISAVSRPGTLKTLAVGNFLLFLVHWIIKFEQVRLHGNFQDLDIPVEKGFVPLGLQEYESLPDSGSYRIPKIIHQTWKNTEIPSKFITWIKTWKANHPDWEYFLWTDESAHALIKDKYPFLLSTFDNYSEGIRKADALRYVILYEFGGVYADMDLESLKPIDPMAKKFSCFISQEPYEHPILDANFEHLVINALIGCQARHPFMKKLMDNLPAFRHMWNVLDSTGPHFVTLIYNEYMKSNIPSIQDQGVFLSPPEYFFPTIDPAKHFWFRMQCGKFHKLSNLQQKACKTLKVKGVNRKPTAVAFTDHHWIHTYIDFRVSLKGPVNIFQIVPDAKIYGNTS
ncbi:mannosyl phosphorylinositol ceramide synthase CSH1-like [Mizuhopecten yessoensis]|uniref:Inositol phosphoceramide mannosyltransferase 3 n=1 Tax=Mizuhopecten yessoensis TaxID=6573 RepID=A0A210QM63_MIZYE|nr:mannosyl phosphorylinositol ceramide synthase CSH1-like [Mizuhopecten yessoensis]OWF49825.1 Inositol phosphoceramide mannosyltransferase 3 [Mizuhopecten yessoensis]